MWANEMTCAEFVLAVYQRTRISATHASAMIHIHVIRPEVVRAVPRERTARDGSCAEQGVQKVRRLPT